MTRISRTVVAGALAFFAAGCAADAQGDSKMASYDKPGFVTEVHDGRLWVFKQGAKELAEFKRHGELAKQVTRIGAGPDRMTVKAPDAETIDAYMAAK